MFIISHGNISSSKQFKYVIIIYHFVDYKYIFPRSQFSYLKYFQIIVEIVNDNKWEPNEEFFLRLSLVYKENANVVLGALSIMEITILDDDSNLF